jgi:hypothetical protein
MPTFPVDEPDTYTYTHTQLNTAIARCRGWYAVGLEGLQLRGIVPFKFSDGVVRDIEAAVPDWEHSPTAADTLLVECVEAAQRNRLELTIELRVEPASSSLVPKTYVNAAISLVAASLVPGTTATYQTDTLQRAVCFVWLELHRAGYFTTP